MLLKYLVLYSFFFYVGSKEVSKQLVCSHGAHLCGDSSKCVPDEALCDKRSDCADSSDENFIMCKIIQGRKRSCPPGEIYHPKLSCQTISDCCKVYSNTSSLHTLCDQIKGGLKSVGENTSKGKEDLSIKKLVDDVPIFAKNMLTGEVAKQLACIHGAHLCADNSKCVADEALCDKRSDCADSSDENFILCKIIQGRKRSCPPGEIYHPKLSCQTISDCCKVYSNTSSLHTLCDQIKGGLKSAYEIGSEWKEDFDLEQLVDAVPIINKNISTEEYLKWNANFYKISKNLNQTIEKLKIKYIVSKARNWILDIFNAQNKSDLEAKYEFLLELRRYLEDLKELVVTAYNGTQLTKKVSTGCPPFYHNINDKCVALLNAFPVTWKQAYQLCNGISGTLGFIRNKQDFEAILKHLETRNRIEPFTGKIGKIKEANFWIGGGYFKLGTTDSFKWMWLDRKDIAMKAPYWDLNYVSNCTRQRPSDLCDYYYSYGPRESREGLCVAMDYQSQYKFSAQNCQEKRSPLCYFKNV